MTDPATVFLVDDDPAVQKGLARLLRSDHHDVAVFASAQDFLAGNHLSRPGCLILDVEMPGLTGVELQQALAGRHSALPIIFLTGHGDIDMGVRAMKLGAVDFLTKPVDADVLLEAVRDAIERSRVVVAARAAMDEVQRLLATLTPREREVLPLVVSGQLNKQVAARLGTVEKTIKVHRAHMMAKLKVRTLADLVHFADRAGIGRPSS
jgi:FixJ family two-component response regulator